MPSIGSLTVVGSGINVFAHCSAQAKAYIEQAERLIVHVPDPLGMAWLRELHPELIDLQPCYGATANRADAYEKMVTTITDVVRAGFQTVAVFYGHPGVFVSPSHEAVRRLRRDGYAASMLPGISAEDCLFADLGIDPARRGCTQHEATRFLFSALPVNIHSGLILWQVGMTGDHTLTRVQPAGGGLVALQQKLLRHYTPEHSVAIYEAPTLSVFSARIEWLPLAELEHARLTPISTLYIPPLKPADPDMQVLNAMGLTVEQAFGN